MPALLALLVASCASNQVVLCGPCPPPHYEAHGLPDLHTRTVVRECFHSIGCSTGHYGATPHDQLGLVGNAMSRQIAPPQNAWPPNDDVDQLDGTTMTVTVRSRGRTWVGTGRLRWVQSSGEVCDCDAGLHADVSFMRRG